MTPPDVKEQARRLFFQSRLTRAQIAAIIGVHPRTLFDWIREGDWKSARNAAANAPALITEHYYTQLTAINRNIATRAERPYPTKEEAEIMRKLSLTIKQVKVRHSIPEIVEIFSVFSHYLQGRYPELVEYIIPCMSNYISSLQENTAQTPVDRYNQAQETRKDWQQYAHELRIQDDIDDMQNIVERYARNMQAQKDDLDKNNPPENTYPDDKPTPPIRPQSPPLSGSTASYTSTYIPYHHALCHHN